MIKTERITIDEQELNRTFSDSGKWIRQVQTGNKYAEAVDVLDSHFTYEETDELIETIQEVEIVE